MRVKSRYLEKKSEKGNDDGNSEIMEHNSVNNFMEGKI
jgi:hypothetical protein